MALVPFNRRADLMNIGFGDIYNMLDDFFAEGVPFRRNLAADTFKVDLSEDDKNYFIEAELPGVEKDEISVSIEEGRLQISVTRGENTEKKDKNYIHRERRYSSMQRSIYLADADNENIKARLDNGVLNITVPKKGKQENMTAVTIE